MRLFVAVRPPVEVLESIALLPRPAVPGVRWTDRQQWHVTLRFLGEVVDPEPVIAAVAAASAASRRPVARLGPVVRRLGARVVQLPVHGLEPLAGAISDATVGMGDPDDRPFRGHLTLARCRGRVPAAVVGAPLTADWSVRTVEVVHSTLGARGAQHRTLGSLPIGR